MFLPVNDDAFNDAVLGVVKVEPSMEYQKEDDPSPPKQERHRKSKLPLWVVTASYEHELDFDPEFFQVKIACEGDPGLTVPGPIRFGGLAFRTWNMNGKKGLSIQADSWTQDPRPSAKRKTEPVVPPAPGGEKKAA